MITENDVTYIAGLARIHLEKEEIQKLTKNLEDILSYITKLQEQNVSEIKPTSHALPLENVYREDTVKPSLEHTEVMKLAVERHQGCFKVPKVIE